MQLDINSAVQQASHEWDKNNALEIDNVNEIGRFKRFAYGKKNEMLPVIFFKPLNGSKKLMRRELTDIEFQQLWFHDIFDNETLYEINYLVPNEANHTRLEVANKFNGVLNEFAISHTIH